MKKIVRKLYYKLSPNLRFFARRTYFLPIDIWHSLFKKKHKYEPPKGKIYIGSGDFISQGNHQLDLLKEHIAINPNDSVLDVGSGIGRTAVPLTEFLSEHGLYEGFDVVEKGVLWCQEKINRDFKNFNFTYVPLNNDLYNNSNGEADKFKFPYQDNTFDKVFLFSVFTHMSVTEIGHYLKEIKRTLKPEGLCLATFFVYNSANETSISTNPNFSFPISKDGYRLMDAAVTSANIALNEDVLNELINASGLKKVNITEGYWKTTEKISDLNDFQDIVVLQS